MNPSIESSLTSYVANTNKQSSQERTSREFEDQVAQMLRGLGFEVHQRVLVPIAHGVHHEVDQFCLSNEFAKNDESIAEERVIWVETKLKLKDGYVGKGELLRIWGAFACMLYKEYDECRAPDTIWVVTNGTFSRAAWNLSKALNEGVGRELFVLIDGDKLKGLMSTQIGSTREHPKCQQR